MTTSIPIEELPGLVAELRSFEGSDALGNGDFTVVNVGADTLESLTAESERLREALEEIQQWSEAYPEKVFPDPDLKAIQNALVNAGLVGQMDRMHGSWARHLTSSIGDMARKALSGGSETNKTLDMSDQLDTTTDTQRGEDE